MGTKKNFDNSRLTNLPILLITAGTQEEIWNGHYEWRHPPDTVMIYTQACQALSNFVHIIPLDLFLKHEKASQFKGKQGLVVDIVGGLYDLDLIGLPPSLAKVLDMPCFPANTKNYVTTHDKLLGKHVAKNSGLRAARTLSGPDLDVFKGPVIQKPICGGDSVGIEYVSAWPSSRVAPIGSFVEEFIFGKDSTIHFIRNNDGESYSLLEHLITTGADSSWFDKKAKGNANRLFGQQSESGERIRFKGRLSETLSIGINKMFGLAGYPFLGRVDFRQTKFEGEVSTNDMIFLELNVAPTISNANNWYHGISENFENTQVFKAIDGQPIHPAAKSLAVMLHEFYVQSLSIHGNKPVRSENFPN